MDRNGLPQWFQRWGIGAWLVVGMFLVIIGFVWLLALTSSIAMPLIAGFVIGAVGGAIVDYLERRGWPRAAGAAVVDAGARGHRGDHDRARAGRHLVAVDVNSTPR